MGLVHLRSYVGLGMSALLLTVSSAPLVFAQEDVSSTQTLVEQTPSPEVAAPSLPEVDSVEVDSAQREIQAKERTVKALDTQIAQYRARIQQQTATADTLRAQLDLLQTRAEAQQLEIRRSRAESERLALEVNRLDEQVKTQEATLTLRRTLLEEILVQLADSQETSPLMALLGDGTLSTYVTRREDWHALQQGLTQATLALKEAQTVLQTKRTEVQLAQVAQTQQTQALEFAQGKLGEEQAAKQSLIAETENREEQYRRVVADLQREQQNENEAASALRDRYHDTIDTADDALARGDLLLDWPIEVKKGISAHFHDESYPFRQLFEHPGLDLPTPVGTPVRAAAGGYIAWNRTGSQYGNYVMIIHPNGIATVYAHLSAFAAKPDTYVERGEIIGYSGGRPGDRGAGLSTGPHLHFEVRQNGLPVNPELFVPEL